MAKETFRERTIQSVAADLYLQYLEDGIEAAKAVREMHNFDLGPLLLEEMKDNPQGALTLAIKAALRRKARDAAEKVAKVIVQKEEGEKRNE